MCFLANEKSKVVLAGNSFVVNGLELPLEYYHKPFSPKLTSEKMEELMGKPDPEAINILLAHNPKYGRTYFRWGADLIFQILIPINVLFGLHFGFVISHGVKNRKVLRQCTKQLPGGFQGGRIHPDHHVSGKKNGIRGIFLDFFQQSIVLFAENASVMVCKNSKVCTFPNCGFGK